MRHHNYVLLKYAQFFCGTRAAAICIFHPADMRDFVKKRNSLCQLTKAV